MRKSRVEFWPNCVLAPIVLGCLLACRARVDPPGSPETKRETTVWVGHDEGAFVADSLAASERASLNVGGTGDNLPFKPNGEKLASIAWRTWIYTDTGPKRTRYGYLRAGAVVDRRGPPIVNGGCEGGWYRINPRGFVCIGKGATTDLTHPVVLASTRRPTRGEALPYVYTRPKEKAPFLYYKLPTTEQMRDAEGNYASEALNWLLLSKKSGVAERIELASGPPAFLAELDELQKPYGTAQGLHQGGHAGRANPEGGFAVAQVFEHGGRAWGLTTELDLIALDRTELATSSDFAGLALDEDEDLPVALVTDPWISRYEPDDKGLLQRVGAFKKRSLLKLSGRTEERGGVTYWETSANQFIVGPGTRRLEPRQNFPSVATGTRKWIDISITHQTLVAYEGKKAVYVTLVSTGLGGLRDPEESLATVRGTYMIHTKEVSSTMNGDEDRSDSYELRDVPFVQYFHKGYALHGAYWHNDFGRARSHGCVNLSPRDAAWLFEFTDPHVPEEWHGVINKERGTVVHIHP